MTREELIKTLQDEMEFCLKKNEEVKKHGEEALAIVWNGKYSGLKLALEYAYELEN